MNESERMSLRDLIRDPVEILSFCLIYGGIVLTTLNQYLVLVTALGLALPALLSRFGAIQRDEFYHETMVKAAAMAMGVVAAFAIGVVAVQGFGGTYNSVTGVETMDDAVPALLILLLAILSYQISFMLIHWGSRIGASRIYMACGALWLAVILLVYTRTLARETPGAMDWFEALAFPAAMFVLSWLSLKRKRMAGLLASPFCSGHSRLLPGRHERRQRDSVDLARDVPGLDRRSLGDSGLLPACEPGRLSVADLERSCTMTGNDTSRSPSSIQETVMSRFTSSLLLVVLLCGLAAAADPVPSGAFKFTFTTKLDAAPGVVWDAITGDISEWWDHTMSEDPVALEIQARPGGYFLERFNDEGDGVVHAVVTYAETDKKLRMEGAMGLAATP